MSHILLTLLLLVATVDPRLTEPLRLLAEVGARESIDDQPGQLYADLPELLDLTLAVVDRPGDWGAQYERRTRTVSVAAPVAAEDPRVVAVVLTHELQHAIDRKRQALDLLDPSCFEIEVRGFEAQAKVARLFWPDDLPSGTELERIIGQVVRVYERDGPAGIAAFVAADAGYRELCVV